MFCLIYPLRFVDTAGDDAESMTGKGKMYLAWLPRRPGTFAIGLRDGRARFQFAVVLPPVGGPAAARQ